MENQREKAGQDQLVAPAIDRLKAAISSAPIEELRAPIEEELGLKEEVDIENLRDSLDLLKDRARLAHRESIETLIEIGSDIAYFLSRIVQLADRNEGASLLEPSTENNEPEGNWRETIDESVNILLDLEAPEDNQEPHRFVNFLEELPYARNSFPLRHLLGKSEPPKRSLREISDLCDRLVQRRLDEELALVAHNLSSRSFCWPLFITAVDCQSKKLLAARTQNLELGKAVASNLGVTPRGEDTPAALVRPLLIGLEQMRGIRRSNLELEDMRRSEEMNEPAPLEQLIEEALKGTPIRHGSWNLQNLWMRKAALLPPLLGDSDVINKWVDAAYAYIASVHSGDFMNPKWVSSINRRMTSKGSVAAGLKHFLRDGFETFAGNDRGSSSMR